MILYQIHDVHPGMILGKSLYHPDGRLLLGAGYRISDDILARLAERGYTHIYIMEDGTENIIPEDVISDEVRNQARMSLSRNVDEIQKVVRFKQLTRDRAKDLIENGYLRNANITLGLKKIIEDILDDIATTGASFLGTVALKSKDTEFIDHAVNTTILAVLIGSKYRFDRDELYSLAMGTFLHDVGKTITNRLTAGDGPASGEDMYREHPTYGYLLLSNNTGLTPSETQVVNQHHEFQDGTGFPIGLKGNNLPPVRSPRRETTGAIYRLAEICAVANRFDNLVMNPGSDQKRSPQDGLRLLIEQAGSRYNRDIVETLHQVVPLYPVGTRVKIVEIIAPNLIGSYGIVARINRNKLNKPVVVITANKLGEKIKPILLDTSKLNRIELKLVI